MTALHVVNNVNIALHVVNNDNIALHVVNNVNIALHVVNNVNIALHVVNNVNIALHVMCDSWFHLSCTNLNFNEFLSHCDNFTLSWACSTCDNNTHCAKCKIEFIPNSLQKNICCDYCDKYFHLKCTDLIQSPHFLTYQIRMNTGNLSFL